MDKNYIVTMTSGSYDDYEHGNVFAVKNEEEGLKIVDLLNAYSNFRNRWREEFFESLRDEGWSPKVEVLRKKYSVPDDLKIVEKMLSDTGNNYHLSLDYPEYWPDDCVFALETSLVVEFEDGN